LPELLRFLPLLMALAAGFIAWHASTRRTLRELNANSAPLHDAGLLQVCARLAAALGVPQVVVRIYEVPAVNGLAAADGQVFLTRGFYERYRSGAVTADEIAAVIAHELGHVALGHAQRRMLDFTAQNALRAALAAVVGRFVPGLGPWLAGLAAQALSARLSREDEYEADAWAAALLAKAGLGPAPLLSLLRKLAAWGGGAQGPAWLMSHPAGRDRIAAVERLTARWG
jgi:putative metalloprotease